MNYGISWTSIKTLLRLELRSRFGSRVETPVKTQIGRALNILFTLIVYGILVLGIYYIADMFIVRSELRYEFLVFSTVFTMVIATAVAIGNVVKNLYMSGDNELLLRFPVNGAGYRPRIYCVQILPDSAMHPKRHRPPRANFCQWTAYFLTSLCLSKGLASKP